MSTIDKQIDHLRSLESLRGIAALMIVFFHLYWLMKVPLPVGLGFIKSAFGMGVPLFYTLSGFVIAYGYSERVETASQIKKFYIARLFRIAPLFYSLLAIMVVRNLEKGDSLDFQTIFINVTFLFGLAPDKHESLVMAGWSIGIEMLFYLAFPWIIMAMKSLKGVAIAFLIACSLSAWVLWYRGFEGYGYKNLLTHLPFFLAGIGGYRIWQFTHFKQNPLGWKLLGVVMVLIASSYLQILPSLGYFGLGFWALILGGMVVSLCLITFQPLEHCLLRRCGELSFSLYLIHPILMVGLSKLNLLETLSSNTDNQWIIFSIMSLLTISLLWLLSNITYRFIELPGIAYGKRMASVLAR